MDVSDSDGHSHHRIVEGDDLPDLGVVNSWYADGSALYLLLRATFSSCASMKPAPPSSGRKTTPIPDGTMPSGCWQDKIILQHNEYYYIPELKKLGTRTEEEYDAWYDEQDAAQLTQPVSAVPAVSTDEGRAPLDFHWTVADGAIAKVQNGIVLSAKPGRHRRPDELIHRHPPPNLLTCPGRPCQTTRTFCLATGQRLYPQTSATATTIAFLNLDTGEFQPQPTTWFNDRSRARPIAPSSGPRITALFFTTNMARCTTPKRHRPRRPACPAMQRSRNEYGIISFDDYLAGSQDWSPRSPLLGDDFSNEELPMKFAETIPLAASR